MQGLLFLIAAGLLLFAGYSLARVIGFEEARAGARLDAPRKPSPAQPIVLFLLSGVAAGAAAALGGRGVVRAPTPARLEELAGRAEAQAVARVGAGAEEQTSHDPAS